MAEAPHPQSGLEKAQLLMGSGRPPGIGEALDFHLISIADGSAICGGILGLHGWRRSRRQWTTRSLADCPRERRCGAESPVPMVNPKTK